MTFHISALQGVTAAIGVLSMVKKKKQQKCVEFFVIDSRIVTRQGAHIIGIVVVSTSTGGRSQTICSI